MLINRRDVRIEWKDCDPAGIVFYPRYFSMFDTSTTALFERALGMTAVQMFSAYDVFGYPLVDARARFIIPLRFCDAVFIESTIREFRRSSFDIEHRIFKDGELAVEGIETRVWTVHDPDDPSRIKSHPLPPDIIAKFTTS